MDHQSLTIDELKKKANTKGALRRPAQHALTAIERERKSRDPGSIDIAIFASDANITVRITAPDLYEPKRLTF